MATNDIDTDDAARAFAVDPRQNVVLEASAGTGKTTVLVQRYVNLLKAGVEPANILAITFTRKAATEMRERIIRELRASANLSQMDRARWLSLRDRLSEIAISTIDAFCLSLLREFPLEADLDPGFDLADETEVPRLVEEALDGAMRIYARLSKTEPDIALVIAQLGVSRTRAGLAALLERRLVAWGALDRFLARGPRDLRPSEVCGTAARDLLAVLQRMPGGIPQLLADGPVNHPRFQLFVRQVGELQRHDGAPDARLRSMLDRIGQHFLTQDGSARRGHSIHPYNASHYPTDAAGKRHRSAVMAAAPEVERVLRRFARELNAVLARGIRRMFGVALEQYRRTMASRSALDFSDVLERALELLRRMDEFSQSRFRLESRYHHVLVDEFQDTSRAQWELVSLLIQSWGEGMGLASNPSIFIVGDRKQSIYRFRDAEVAVLQEAGRYIEGLRPGGGARRSIARSFRSVPELLEFVNEVCAEMAGTGQGPDRFTYTEADRFPPVAPVDSVRGPALGIAAADTQEACAAAVAAEIRRILAEDTVRDKKTGVARAARPGDIAILFRSRTSHREFERALELRNIPTYVYKGLGFFDSDEIKDASALLRYLADPASDYRAAALLRSRVALVSDRTLALLAPRIASAIRDGVPAGVEVDADDARVLEQLRRHVPRWLALVDRLPPADLFEQVTPEIAYAFEIRGRRYLQAWENLKKMRGLVRRIQNRGYATLSRIADHIDSLTAGDESNAVLEALDAVNLMTVHASKGLEFPVVFVVNLSRGANGIPRPVRVIADGANDEPSVSIAAFTSESDELEREREQHETRRLMYVAMTRARDRLYLSSALKEGTLAPGRGSLADVLPVTLRGTFAEAARSDGAAVAWTSPSGRSFTFRACVPPSDAAAAGADATDASLLDVTAPLPATGVVRRVTVSEWLRAEETAVRQDAGGGAGDGALVGVLVHRLFEAFHRVRFEGAEAEVRARALLRPSERADAADIDAVITAAASAWRRLVARPEMAGLLSSSELLAEVPFSLALEQAGSPVVLRGSIDCLSLSGNEVTVVELKTGARRPVHGQQLALYVRAARTLFPERAVDGILLYDD